MDNQGLLVGSQAYTTLLGQKIKNAKKIGDYQALLQQVLAHLGSYFDNHGDLKLLNRFAAELHPNSKFFVMLAQLVQQAFPQGLASGIAATEPLRKMVHQLRYYLDAINVHYLRQHYPNANSDWQRLIYYDRDCYHAQLSMSRAEPARLHNRLDQNLMIPVAPGWNIKRVYGFHVEFILDWQGNFVWLNLMNVNQTNPGQVINCSSFNYANQNDHLHQLLDIHYNAVKSVKDPSLRAFFNRNTVAPAKANLLQKISEFNRQWQFECERRKIILLNTGSGN